MHCFVDASMPLPTDDEVQRVEFPLKGHISRRPVVLAAVKKIAIWDDLYNNSTKLTSYLTQWLTAN